MATFSYDDFRAIPELRVAVGQFLNSDVGKIMLRVLRERYKPSDVPSNADAIASARVLSQFHGAHIAIDDLEAMAVAPKTGFDLEPNFLAADTDHDRMPESTTPQVAFKYPMPPEDQTNAQ